MRCNLALINFEASAYNYYTKIIKINYYDYEILTKYFIIDTEMIQVRSSCGKCVNKECKAYLKNQ